MVRNPDATRDRGGELLRQSCSSGGRAGGFAPTFQNPRIQDHDPGALQPDGAVPLQGLERALDHLASEPVIARVMCLGFMTAQAHMRFWFAVTWVLGLILPVGVLLTVVDLLSLHSAETAAEHA